MIRELFTEVPAAKDIIKSLAEHYSQDIHFTTNRVVPYFDPLHGSPIQASSFVAHLQHDLQEAITRDNYHHVGATLVESYKLIQQKCFHIVNVKKHTLLKPAAHVILIRYEQLVHHFIHGIDAGAKGEHKMDHAEEIIQAVHSMTVRMMLDIFSLISVEKVRVEVETKMERDREKNDGGSQVAKDRLRNCILPVLLRILQHFITFRQQLHLASPKLGNDQHSDLRYLTSLASLAALSFCKDEVWRGTNSERGTHINLDLLSSNNLHLKEILPTNFGKELVLNHIMNMDLHDVRATPPPNQHICLDARLKFVGLDSERDAFMDEPFIDFKNSSVAIFPMPWLDHTKGIGARAASSLLHHVVSLAQCLEGGANVDEVDVSFANDVKCFEDVIMKHVGREYVCKLAREFFFDRLAVPSACQQSEERGTVSSIAMKNKSSRSLAFNGIVQVNKDADDCDHGEHIERPSRSVAPIRVFAALKFPDVSSAIFSEVLPVIFTLIDSSHGHLQAFGASLLLLLLKESTTTSFHSTTIDSRDQSRFHNTEKILSLGCRTCDCAVTLYILSTARCQLFEMLPFQETNTFRRNAASSMLNRVQKSSYSGPGGKPESLELLYVMLAGTLQPILHKLAQLPNANSMELGRQGLSIILPLIRWDSNTPSGRRIQISSMSCLSSLMMGAYPMMVRHGEKIMAELLSCVGRAQRDLQIQEHVQGKFGTSEEETFSTKATLLIAIHATSQALILCGKHADDVLTRVENGPYVNELKNACFLIREGSKAMVTTQIVSNS